MSWCTNLKKKRITVIVLSIILNVILFTGGQAASNVSFKPTSDWGSGFVANVTVTNATENVSTGWQVEFDFPYNITNIWSSKIVSHSGSHYVIENESWNGVIQPRASITFGFQGAPGNVTPPTNVTSTLDGGSSPTPEQPVANDDSVTVNYQTSTTINVLNNDSGNGIKLALLNSQPLHGTTNVLEDGNITYTPDSGFYGNDSFKYTIKDSIDQVSSAEVNIIVNQPAVDTYTITATCVNISSGGSSSGSYPEFVQPYAGDSLYMKGNKITFNENSYESLIDNNSWSPSAYPGGWEKIGSNTGTGGGTIAPNGNITVNEGSSRQIIITPDSGYSVNDVKVDGQPIGKVTSYTFSNISANHIIIAEFKEDVDDPDDHSNDLQVHNDSFSLEQNTTAAFSVLSNDTGNSLQITSVTEPAKGTAGISADKTFITYSGYLGATGSDSFQYIVTDSGNNTATATVAVNITGANPVSEGFYHTSGNQILDSNNNPVRIEGVNWFGFEATDRIPHGLWSRNYKEMMNQMKELGFNTIRLPFNNEMFDSEMMPNLNYWANPELEGLTPIQVMDKIVEYAGEIGLKIILDHHRSDTSDVGAIGDGLWYTDAYPESRWISDWIMLAERYKNNSTVIGADIHNEPHADANWGQGGVNDWKAAAEKCGNSILVVNPNWLILVEGIEAYNDNYYWWGGNLEGAKEHPLKLNVSGRLVYSPHIYPNSVWNQPWFSEADYPNNLSEIWDKTWGYIYKENIAPIIVGEFGSKFEDSKDLLWLNKLSEYLNLGQKNGDAGISWTYWSWNPNSSDTGGILKNDWISVHQNKLDYLSGIRFNSEIPGNSNPAVSFNSHVNGESIIMSSLSTVNISITAEDSDGEITETKISVDGQIFTGATAGWIPSGFGTFNITATAVDNEGAVTNKSITVTVQNEGAVTNLPPNIAFCYPADNSTIKLTELSPINISVTADDEDGSVTATSISVESLIFDSSTAIWTPSAFNSFDIVATATDNEGAVSTATINVIIQLSDQANITGKQVIGYITQWDAWKGTEHGYSVAGINNQLNVDYSKFTMLNYSFFGVAEDGSLHSGDYRNKNIWKETEVQGSAPLIHEDIYSSWDKWLLYGELPHNSNPKIGAGKGLIQLCDENGVNLMASIGGWSMCKHFSEMAADKAKKARFLEGCRQLIQMGFDGIDIDWEYPGPFKGMNFTGTQDDYVSFTALMHDIREVIGPDKLLTAAFSCDPKKLNSFNWNELDRYMDYYNIMSYDMAGGWSDNAGHNSALYAPEGQFSWNNTFRYLTESLGIDPGKINMGISFYGRGVVTDGTADLGTATVKRWEEHDEPYGPPDGPMWTAHDYDNWKTYWGQPDYRYIKQKEAEWIYHWDDNAKVPYITKGSYFVSFDDERSVQLKADYVLDNNAAGVIIWHVFGDWNAGPVTQTIGGKFPYCPEMTTPLLDVIFYTFNTNGSASHL